MYNMNDYNQLTRADTSAALDTLGLRSTMACFI